MIDLDRELIELFNKEQMIAFFDFQVTRGEGAPNTGLCKISRPKSGARQSQYISLLFLIDTPEKSDWQQVDAFLGNLDWNTFQHELPGVVSVLPIPHLDKSSCIYFKEVDIYLTNSVSLGKSYVKNLLYPAVLRVMEINCGEMVFWDDIPECKPEVQGLSTENKSPGSIVERFKNFFGL